MEWIIDNSMLIIVALAMILCVIMGVLGFKNMDREEQIKKVKEWLLWAVEECERELGRDTGVLKLRMCYNMFLESFPWLAKVITFQAFSDMVKDAVKWLDNQLKSNENVRKRVYGE